MIIDIEFKCDKETQKKFKDRLKKIKKKDNKFKKKIEEHKEWNDPTLPKGQTQLIEKKKGDDINEESNESS